jgi:galactokinase/mevalonate kinase-like predicted kinase
MVFAYENPPGTERFSGSQDAIGVVFPGLNRLEYAGNFWPRKISSLHDDPILTWLENHIRLVSLGPRRGTFDVLRRRQITRPNARALAQAADAAWHAILHQDLPAFGRFCRQSFEAQAALFPGMLNPLVRSAIKRHAHLAHGWKLSGAGGGGYLVLITDRQIPGAIRLAIRRRAG